MPRPPALPHQIARSVGAPPELLPVFRTLFSRVDSLGPPPGRLASMLIAAGVGPRSRVLDLACGKGALAIELARRTGCHVVGVDGCPEFLETAADRARREGVARRCRWVLADVRAWRARESFDAAVMVGLDGMVEAARRLRRFVPANGVYGGDDALRGPRGPADAPDADEVAAAIEELGDRVLRRCMLPRAAVAARGGVLLRQLAQGARDAAAQRPDLVATLRTLLRDHRRAAQLLLGPLRPTFWVARRGSAG